MNFSKKVVALLCVLSLVGCVELEKPRRQNYIEAHPNLSGQTKENILSGKVSIGMTQEDVAASWGIPASKSTSMNWLGTVEMWQYGGCTAYGCRMSMVTFSNGKVSNISQNS